MNQTEENMNNEPNEQVDEVAQPVNFRGKADAAAGAIRAACLSIKRRWPLNGAVAALALLVSLGGFGWWVSSTNGRLWRLEKADEDLYKNISSLSSLVTEANTGLAAANGRHEALSATVAKQINQLQADSKAMQDEVLLLVQSEAHNQEIARLKKEDEEAAVKLLAEKKPTGFSGLLASIKNKFK